MMSVQQPFASPSFARTPAAVTGGMDASGFFNALRRRWLLATSMGLLLAAGVGAGLYWLFPESDTATALFLVKANEDTAMGSSLNVNGTAKDFGIFRATQQAQMKSMTVINAALANPNIADSQILKEADNAAMWLTENLAVGFEGDSELMRVSITETVGDKKSRGEELRKIVAAVCQAYEDEVVHKSRFERGRLRDSLNSTQLKLREEIRQKWDEYRQIVNDLGISENQFDPALRVLFENLKTKMSERAKLEEQSRNLQLEYARWKSMKDNPDLKEQSIEAQVSADPNIQMMEQEMLYMQAQLREVEKRSHGRMNNEMKRIQEQIQQQAELTQREKSRMREQIKQQIASSPDIEVALYTEMFQRQLFMIANRLRDLKEGADVPAADGEVVHEMGINELVDELEAKAKGSTDLVIRKAELSQLEVVANDLGRRIEALDIELSQDDNRIRLIEDAYVIPGINKIQRYLIAGLGSVATLVLSCLGIAYLEFLGRRLNGPKQVDEGLGIRVVGTLPKLKARHQAQIMESIDSVRTALMHESTSRKRQVVLVTSPRTMEGRTTVASQLAASLARAGRRTLLIDGDLRRPALHSLFNVPLEDGLCEVLRAEVEVSDIVRATKSEGLWLMTAGYCDSDAVHAMATDQIQPIFEKLRSEYDFIIIDGAPVLGLSDSLMMGQHCDGALLSVLRDYSTVPDIYQSSDLLRSVGIRLIGSVVNGVGSKADGRVSHLQMAAPKSNRKQIESQPVAAAKKAEAKPEAPAEEFDFDDLSLDDE